MPLAASTTGIREIDGGAIPIVPINAELATFGARTARVHENRMA
jgi:hypothetical protein